MLLCSAAGLDDVGIFSYLTAGTAWGGDQTKVMCTKALAGGAHTARSTATSLGSCSVLDARQCRSRSGLRPANPRVRSVDFAVH